MLEDAQAHQPGSYGSQSLGALDEPAIVRRANIGQHMSICVIQRAVHDHILSYDDPIRPHIEQLYYN